MRLVKYWSWMRSLDTLCMIFYLLVVSLNLNTDNYLYDRLHAEDLAHLLGMQQKELRKLCARLREDRLIAV